MVFNSFEFGIFLPLVFIAYWATPSRHRWCTLLAASCLFYGFCGPRYLLLLAAVTGVSYGAGRVLENAGPKGKKHCLWLTLTAIFGVLAFYKYFPFLWENLCRVLDFFGAAGDPFLVEILLPVGISFYTFVAAGYVVDVYRGKVAAQKHFGKYALFVCFFPSLLSGPIERADNLLAQINRAPGFDYGLAVSGLRDMLMGFFKKMVVADSLAVFVNKVYADVDAYRGFALLLAMIFYTLQIYCDFSGYSDIAVGVSKLLGFRLRSNFRRPYRALSIKDFWSRWHISLSTWFRDYVYIPLGGNRVSPARHKGNLMLTFLISGLWHGAGWNYIIWGGIHGTLQVLESLGNRKKAPRVPAVFRWFAVMVLVSAAWVFFRAQTVSDAVYVLTHWLDGIRDPVGYLMAGLYAVVPGSFDLLLLAIPVVVFLALEGFCAENDFSEQADVLCRPLRWGVYALLVLLILFFTPVASSATFLYFQF